jgi:hypothetical protein
MPDFFVRAVKFFRENIWKNFPEIFLDFFPDNFFVMKKFQQTLMKKIRAGAEGVLIIF